MRVCAQTLLELVICSVRDASFPHVHSEEAFQEKREFYRAVNGIFIVRHYIRFLLHVSDSTDIDTVLQDHLLVQRPGLRTGRSPKVSAATSAADDAEAADNDEAAKVAAPSATASSSATATQPSVVSHTSDDAFASSILFDLVEVLTKVATGDFGVVSKSPTPQQHASAGGGASGRCGDQWLATEHFVLRFEAINCLVVLLTPRPSRTVPVDAARGAPTPSLPDRKNDTEIWHLLFREGSKLRAGGAAWAPALMSALLRDVTQRASSPPNHLCQQLSPTTVLNLNHVARMWEVAVAEAAAATRARSEGVESRATPTPTPAPSRSRRWSTSLLSPLSSVWGFGANIITKARESLEVVTSGTSEAAASDGCAVSSAVAPGRSILLLLVLLHTYTSSSASAREQATWGNGSHRNPFGESLRLLRDEDAENAMSDSDDEALRGGDGTSDSNPPCDATAPALHATASFRALFAALRRLLQEASRAIESFGRATRCDPSEQVAASFAPAACALVSSLFSYTLLHTCTEFREYALSRSDLDMLVVPLLQCACVLGRWFLKERQQCDPTTSSTVFDNKQGAADSSDDTTARGLLTEAMQLILTTIMSLTEDEPFNNTLHCDLFEDNVSWHVITKHGSNTPVLPRVSLGSLVSPKLRCGSTNSKGYSCHNTAIGVLFLVCRCAS